jgi:hypothetical protein
MVGRLWCVFSSVRVEFSLIATKAVVTAKHWGQQIGAVSKSNFESLHHQQAEEISSKFP